MEIVNIMDIDYKALGYKIAELRATNENLRRYVCFFKHATACDEYVPECASGARCDACAEPEEAEVSQQELGMVLGASRDKVYSWETGRTSPELPELDALAKICGMSLPELMESVSEYRSPQEINDIDRNPRR